MKAHLLRLRLRPHQMVDDVAEKKTRFYVETGPSVIRMGKFTIGRVNNISMGETCSYGGSPPSLAPDG